MQTVDWIIVGFLSYQQYNSYFGGSSLILHHFFMQILFQMSCIYNCSRIKMFVSFAENNLVSVYRLLIIIIIIVIIMTKLGCVKPNLQVFVNLFWSQRSTTLEVLTQIGGFITVVQFCTGQRLIQKKH